MFSKAFKLLVLKHEFLHMMDLIKLHNYGNNNFFEKN